MGTGEGRGEQVSHYIPSDYDMLVTRIAGLLYDLADPGQLTFAEYLRYQRLLQRALRRLDKMQKMAVT